MGESGKTEVVKDKASEKKEPGKKVISSFWEGLKSEFTKITWPSRETVGKQTVAVTIICAVMAALIAVLDYVFGLGLNFIQNL